MTRRHQTITSPEYARPAITLTSLALAIAASSTAAAGCSGIGEVNPDVTEIAEVRVVHASADAPPVDIYVAGSDDPVIAGLAYGSSSAYLEVAAGAYQFEVRAAGAEPGSAPVYSTDTLELAAGDRITAIAAGLLDGTGQNDQFRVLTLAEGFAPASSDAVAVRVVHAGADAPTVALDLGDDGSVELENLDRFGDTGVGGVQIPAGAAAQVAVLAGHPLERVTAFTVPALPAGAEVFAIATGTLAAEPREADGFALLAVTADSAALIRQNPRLYVLHAGPDAPAVDITTGGAIAVDGLAYGELAGPLQVPPAADETVSFEIFAAGDTAGSPVGSAHAPALEAGGEYLLVATGFLAPQAGEAAFEVLAFADELATDDPHAARLRAIHASPDAPEVDISTVSGLALDRPVLVGNLAFGSADDAAGLSVPAVGLQIGVGAAGSADALAAFDVAASPGMRALVIAAGSLGDAVGRQPFGLIAIDTSPEVWSAAALPAAH